MLTHIRMLLHTLRLRRYRLSERSDHRTPTDLDLTADHVAFPAVDRTAVPSDPL